MLEQGVSHEVEQVQIRTFVQTVEFDGEVGLVTGTYEVKDTIEEVIERHNAYSYKVHQVAEGLVQLADQKVLMRSEPFGEYRIYQNGVLFTRRELEGYSPEARKRNGAQGLLSWMDSLQFDRVIKTTDGKFHGFGPNDRVLQAVAQAS